MLGGDEKLSQAALTAVPGRRRVICPPPLGLVTPCHFIQLVTDTGGFLLRVLGTPGIAPEAVREEALPHF